MKLTEKGDTVTLEMTRGDWENLLRAVGIAAGVSSHDPDKTVFWHWIDFANRLNADIPGFVPHAVPEGFKRAYRS
jgi:alpha-L-fucosidase